MKAIRYIIAAVVGATIGWLITEPWHDSFGNFRDYLIMFGVSLLITLSLIFEKYIIFGKFNKIIPALKNYWIYIVLIFGVLLIKIILTPKKDFIVGTDLQQENRILLLDNSSSMSGRALRELKESVTLYIDILNESQSNDFLGCVSFNSNVDYIQQLTNNYVLVKEIVDDLEASGGTRMDKGLVLAFQVLETNLEAGVPSEIILVSDGMPDDESAVRELIRQKDDIVINTIGVGRNYDRNLLKFIANRTDGRFYAADDISDLTATFQEIAYSGITQSSGEVDYSLPLGRRVIAWALLGLLIGILVGLDYRSRDRLIIGIIAGLSAGLICSLLFHLVDQLGISGPINRFISFNLFAIIIAISLYFVEYLYFQISDRADKPKSKNDQLFKHNQ